MARIEKILCPIDFSDFSRRAFDRAIGIARSCNASVTALHVVWDPFLQGVLPYVGPESRDLVTWPTVDRARTLSELRGFLSAGSTGVPVDYEVIEAPAVHVEIGVQAERLPADLIVMGTHGRSGFQRLVLGSVTEKVLRTASRPVLTMPPDAPDAVPRRAPAFSRILCATDFSDCSRTALQYAAALSIGSGATLTALHVVELAALLYDPLLTPPVDQNASRAQYEAAGRARLERWLQETLPDRTVEQVVTTGRAYKEILGVAAAGKSDLIVLGIHGRNPIDRLMFGSTVEPVVRRAGCPVLTVRPGAEAAAAAA